LKPSKEQRKHLAELQSLMSGDEATRSIKGEYILRKDFIPDNSAIIAPIIMDFGTKVIVVSNRKGNLSVSVIDLPTLRFEKIASLVDSWTSNYRKLNQLNSTSAESAISLLRRNQLWHDWLDAIESVSRDLGSILVAPVVSALHEIGVPAGARLFWMLPAGVTSMPLASAVDPATGERLNDFYESVLITNLEELQFVRKQAAKARELSFLALANSTGDLEFAEIEGTLAASHLPSDARTIINEGKILFRRFSLCRAKAIGTSLRMVIIIQTTSGRRVSSWSRTTRHCLYGRSCGT
jgi:hypothetical protein